MCRADCRCCKPERDPDDPANMCADCRATQRPCDCAATLGDEMLSGDEFIKRWSTPELSGPAA